MTPTGEQLADYFGKILHNDADVRRIIGVSLIALIWVLVVVYITKGEKIKAYVKNKSGNLKTEPNFINNKTSNGYVYDVNNNKILNMDMNPINDSGADIFVPKYGNNNESFVSVSNNVGEKVSNKSDMTTEVNTFMNLIIKGERSAVFGHLKVLKSKGISISDFSANIILELDTVLRSRVEGEVNKHNALLFQVTSSWSREKIESVIEIFLSILDQSYLNQTIGLKVALMRMLRA